MQYVYHGTRVLQLQYTMVPRYGRTTAVTAVQLFESSKFAAVQIYSCTKFLSSMPDFTIGKGQVVTISNSKNLVMGPAKEKTFSSADIF